MAAKILIVDDEESIRLSLEETLKGGGNEIITAENGEEALERIAESQPDLMLLDMKMPKMGGLEVLQKIKNRNSNIKVIVLTAHGDMQTALLCGRVGVRNFIEKPFDLKEMRAEVESALEPLQWKQDADLLRHQQQEEFDGEFIRCQNPKMQQIYRIAEKVSQSNATTVLLRGESGTGKEVIAKLIHYNSKRRDHMFLEVNCTALPEALLESELFGHEKGAFTDAKKLKKGMFELADKGTLFLDEIGDMSFSMQAKLLRALQEKRFQRVGGINKVEVDIRIVASTNKNLEQAMKDGQFREDLYYRLQVVPITIPPLRERPEDIMPLVRNFVAKFNIEFKNNVASISAGAEKMLLQYQWPGNVRELRNVIERAILLESETELLAEHLLLSDIEPKADGALAEMQPDDQSMAAVEKVHIARVLKSVNWNKNKAAKLLGIDRTTLYTKIKRYELAEPVPVG
jgi:two-component system, NtrC family, response regulator AtoC